MFNVCVTVGVCVLVTDGVGVRVGVAPGVLVTEGVGVRVGVFVGVTDGVIEMVGVIEIVGVGVGREGDTEGVG